MYRRTMDNVSLDRFVNIIQADVSPRGTSVANSVAYSAGMVFGDSLFVGKPNYGMYRIFYVQQGIAVWEPFGWLIGGEGNIDTSNYVMAFATDGDWLYILMKDSDLDAGETRMFSHCASSRTDVVGCDGLPIRYWRYRIFKARHPVMHRMRICWFTDDGS